MVKFDVVVGNPPYQGEASDGNKNYSAPIYPDFMDSAYSVADKAMLITPARFLFNAGGTKKAWNRKMLDDPHFKVVHFEMDSSKVFDNTDIKGGVVITYRDVDNNEGSVDIFVPFDELSRILSKVEGMSDFKPFSTIAYHSGSYKLSEQLVTDYPNDVEIQKRGAGYGAETNVFDKLQSVFSKTEPKESDDYIRIYGRSKADGRTYRWIRRGYLDAPENLEKWKVLLPKSNGSGAIGEVLSTPLVGQPLVGHTRTFMSFGSFDNENEAESCLKYIKSKFARTMLGVLKITQDNHPQTWAKVPLQDFTKDSDIDWTKSIAEIDQQLYEKYGLSEEEITFIETHVKQMD